MTYSGYREKAKWVVVGAGPVGCHICISLIHRKLAAPNEILVVDPNPPLRLWRKRTQNCGMEFLRSSCVHHIGVSSGALSRFQKRRWHGPTAWRGRTACPRLGLFDAHCTELLRDYNLEARWQPAEVQSVTHEGTGFSLKTDMGRIWGESIVLALGPVFRKQLPRWLAPIDGSVDYVLDPDFEPSDIPKHSRIAVIGGGMSAAQSALKLAEDHQVTLLTRKAIDVSEFDFASGWMAPVGPSFLGKKPVDRLRVLQRARRPGTVNAEIRRRLNWAVRRGSLQLKRLVAPSCTRKLSAVALRDDDWQIEVDRVVLGTGFQRSLHPLQEAVVGSLGAPVVSGCYPLLDHHLQWLPNLYVAGCGCELQLGPPASNLLGARLAASRIAERFTS